MEKSSRWITSPSIVAAALLCLMPQTKGFAQSYSIRPTCNPNGQCRVKTETFGFNDTDWRSWPVQPRPERQNSKTIGANVLPTPPAIPEQPLPHAEGLPARPPLSGGGTGGSLLPLPGSTPGATPAPDLKIDGGTSPGPTGTPGVSGLPGMPGLDLGPSQPAPKPKTDGGGVEPLLPPKEPLLPGGTEPVPLTPPSAAPAPQPPKTPEKEISPPKEPLLPGGTERGPLTPSPDTPAPNRRRLRRKRRKKRFPCRNCFSLRTCRRLPAQSRTSRRRPRRPRAVRFRRPEKMRSRQEQRPFRTMCRCRPTGTPRLSPKRSATTICEALVLNSCAAETGNPLRCALDGYCPVQLQDNDRWVAGTAGPSSILPGASIPFLQRCRPDAIRGGSGEICPRTQRQ